LQRSLLLQGYKRSLLRDKRRVLVLHRPRRIRYSIQACSRIDCTAAIDVEC
jgi:hypothetical protein